MALITPDDFKDQPYVLGLNQAFHYLFGYVLAEYLGLLISIVVYSAVELYQRFKLDATRDDFHWDMTFWTLGAFSVTHPITTNHTEVVALSIFALVFFARGGKLL